MGTSQHLIMASHISQGAGRLVIKDIIMMAGGLVAAAECAKRYLENKSNLRNSSILKGLLR